MRGRRSRGGFSTLTVKDKAEFRSHEIPMPEHPTRDSPSAACLLGRISTPFILVSKFFAAVPISLPMPGPFTGVLISFRIVPILAVHLEVDTNRRLRRRSGRRSRRLRRRSGRRSGRSSGRRSGRRSRGGFFSTLTVKDKDEFRSHAERS